MRVEMKLTGVDHVLALLKSLPPEVVSKRGGPVKTALRKGAVVIFKAARANLQQAVSNATTEERRQSTGLLLKNLVVTRGKEPRDTKGERYLVRVRRKSYGRKGKPVTTLATAQMLEYGTVKQPAEPWLRPAFETNARQAIDTATAELARGLDRIVKRLGRPAGR